MLDSNVKAPEGNRSPDRNSVYGELPRKLRKLKNQEIVVNLEEPSSCRMFPCWRNAWWPFPTRMRENPSASDYVHLFREGKTYLSVNLALSWPWPEKRCS